MNVFKADFDQTDPKNVGRPLFFNLNHYIEAIEQMIRADELERALWMCDNLPAWYRDNVPMQITEIKKTLFRQMYDAYQYSSEKAIEDGWTKEDALKQGRSGYFYPRIDILAENIKKLNDVNFEPWLCELSPSHGAMALTLLDSGLKFSYFAKNLNDRATDTLREWLPDGIWQERPKSDQKTIFVFFEAIEHVYREKDLEHAYYKLNVDFDEIYLSTPYGCLGGGLPNWNTRPLGHVRGYTGTEFVRLASDFFPKRTWQMTMSHSMVLVGTKL